MPTKGNALRKRLPARALAGKERGTTVMTETRAHPFFYNARPPGRHHFFHQGQALLGSYLASRAAKPLQKDPEGVKDDKEQGSDLRKKGRCFLTPLFS